MLYGIGRFITVFATFCRSLYTEPGECRMKGCLHFRMYVFVTCVCNLKVKVFKTVILHAVVWGRKPDLTL